MRLKLLDLFSGIGGFSLGLESTGYFETVAFVEKDKFCQQVLKKNFPNIPIESEVRNVKGERYAADIITGGFPCQPFSVAGKRRGTDDDRYLWDETIRIIRECKPKWFIGENVEGIINIQDGLVLRQVQDDLEKEGFQVQCLVIPASGIGAWHQRKRVWILAYSEHNGSHRSKGNETIKSSNQSKEWLFIGDDKDVPNTKYTGLQNKSGRGYRKLAEKSYREKETRNQSTLCTSSSCSDVPNSNSRLSIGENEEVQARGNTINDGSKDVSDTNSGVRRRWRTKQSSRTNEVWRFCIEKEKQTQHDIRSKTIGCDAIHGEDVLNSNSIGLQRRSIQSNNLQETSNSTETTNTSFKEQYTWWQTQSSFCGVPNGISYELDKSRSNRIKSLGNSIVPLIARELGIAIMKAEQDG